jgi:6-phosphogluconolactonase
MDVYIGTFTGTQGRGEGIYLYTLDAAGGLSRRQVFTGPGTDNPSFLALHPQRPLLFAVNSIDAFGGEVTGSVAAFAIDPSSGALTFLNSQPSNGRRPIHLTVDASGRWLVVANITGGTVASLPIDQDGRLGPPADTVAHSGLGPNPARQEGPHPHCVTPDAVSDRVLSCDLGADRIFVHRVDGQSGRLTTGELPFAQVSSGAGPRHVGVHPGGRWAYVINELDTTMSVFAYDPERGTLQITQTVSTVPPDATGTNPPAEVFVSPDGRFVYGSNRGHDSIAVFAVDEASGRLTPRSWVPTGGRTPRSFGIDPAGQFLIAANQDSDNLVAFRIDPQSGGLTRTAEAPNPSPVCVVFRA